MSDETQAPPPSLPTLLRSADFNVVFANNVRIRVAAGEFGLAFGFTDEVQGALQIEEKVLIALMPHIAKILSVALNAAVGAYERQHGPIRTAANTLANMEQINRAIMEAIKPLGEQK